MATQLVFLLWMLWILRRRRAERAHRIAARRCAARRRRSFSGYYCPSSRWWTCKWLAVCTGDPELFGPSLVAQTGGIILSWKLLHPNKILECACKDTFMYICNQQRSTLNKLDTPMRKAIPVEKCVAVALWRLSTNVEYRTVGHLFRISQSTVCVIVHEVSKAINNVLTPVYIKNPTGQQLREIIDCLRQMGVSTMCWSNRW